LKKLPPFALLAAVASLAACATPLQKAAANNDVAGIKAELAKGTNVDQRNAMAETPLMKAAFLGNKEAVEALIAGGADVNAGWHYGTPLAYAATRGNEEIARLLVEHGAQPTEEAAQAAVNGGHPKLAEEILKLKKEQTGTSAVDAPAFKEAPRPNALAVLIGAGPSGDSDVEALAKNLKALGFSPDNIAAVSGAKATRAQVAARFDEWLPARLKADSTVLVYFSGKADAGKDGAAMLVTADTDPSFVQSTAYPLSAVYAAAARAPKAVVVLAAGLDAMKTEALTPPSHVAVVAAAAPGQAAGTPYRSHDLFTYFLLDGLTHGKRSAKDLYEYARPKVEAQAKQAGREQTPLLLGEDAAL